ncbi:MAG: hypothetical protein CSA62_05325 [Planctomycetota bacterium]|nr:MAG: hypothetical protein CSA62_05325 [Planctomycetota bacterium]
MQRKLGPTLPSTIRAEGVARRPFLFGVLAALILSLALLGSSYSNPGEQHAALPLGHYQAVTLGRCQVELPRSDLMDSLRFEILCRIRPGSEPWARRRFEAGKGRLRSSTLSRFSAPDTATWTHKQIEAQLTTLAQQALFPDESAIPDDTQRRMEVTAVRLLD